MVGKLSRKLNTKNRTNNPYINIKIVKKKSILNKKYVLIIIRPIYRKFQFHFTLT